MSNQYNPFAEFAKFDMSKFDVSKMLGDVKVPGVDVEALLASQRKNVEALTTANKVALEGLQAVAKRQAEILAQALAEATSVAKELAGLSSNPQELTAKQAAVAKEAFEKALANARELAELVNKSNTEAFAVINQRVNESLEELKALVVKK